MPYDQYGYWVNPSGEIGGDVPDIANTPVLPGSMPVDQYLINKAKVTDQDTGLKVDPGVVVPPSTTYQNLKDQQLSNALNVALNLPPPGNVNPPVPPPPPPPPTTPIQDNPGIIYPDYKITSTPATGIYNDVYGTGKPFTTSDVQKGIYDNDVLAASNAKGGPLTQAELNAIYKNIYGVLPGGNPGGNTSGNQGGGLDLSGYNDIEIAGMLKSGRISENQVPANRQTAVNNAKTYYSAAGTQQYSGVPVRNAVGEIIGYQVQPEPTVTTGTGITEPNLRPFPVDAETIVFDDTDLGTIPEAYRPMVQQVLIALGYVPTGFYGTYGAREYKRQPGSTRLFVTDQIVDSVATDDRGKAWIKWLMYRKGLTPSSVVQYPLSLTPAAEPVTNPVQ